MKNKKRLFISLTLALVLFSLTVTTAFCIWYISDVKESTPEYVDDPITEYFDGTSIKYNGNFLLPTSRVFEGASEIDTSNLEYWYQGENDSEYIKCVDGESGPQNAGSYNIKIKYKVKYTDESGIEHIEDKEKVITFTILPIDISDVSNKYQAIFKSHSDNRFEYYSCDNKNYTSHNPVIPSDLQVYNTESTKILTIDTEYTVVYTNNTGDAGTEAVATITGCGNYTGIIELKYIIYKQLYLSGDTAQSTTYNGSNQTPVVVVKDEAGNIIDSNEYECSYMQGSSISNAVNAKSTPYDIKVTVTPKDTNKYQRATGTYKMTITPKEIALKSIDYELSYSGTLRTWGTVKAEIANQIEFEDLVNGDTLAIGTDYTFEMSDGFFIYKYASSDAKSLNSTQYKEAGIATSYNYVIGSTYLVTVELKNDNYKLIGDTTNIFKYKTVKINNSGTVYYTIEDALKQASTSDVIIALGNASNTEYVISAFTSLDSSVSKYSNAAKETINGTIYTKYIIDKKIRIPFADVDLDFHGSGGDTASQRNSGTWKTTAEGCENVYVARSNTVYSTLYIPRNVSLNVTKEIVVGGLLTSCGTVQNRGILMNNGYITVASGAKLASYGYTKSSYVNSAETNTLKSLGMIDFQSGSYAIDVFRMFEWPGGAKAVGLNDNKFFVCSAYSVHNIGCKTIIKQGATYEGFWNIEFNNSLFSGYQRGDKNGNAIIIGSSGLFNLSSGYIEKMVGAKATNQTTQTNAAKGVSTITGSNQYIGQMDVIDIFGTTNDSSVKINIKASGQSVDVATSTDMALPISYMDITIKSGASLAFRASSYKFFPGTSLTVEEGGTFTIGKDVNTLFYTIDGAINDEKDKILDGTALQFITSNSTSDKKCVNRVDAMFTNNGVVTVESGGYLGGKIYNTIDGAKVNVTGNANASVLVFVSATQKTFLGKVIGYNINTLTRNYNLTGELTNGITESEGNFSAGQWQAANEKWYKVKSSVTVSIIDGDGNILDSCSIPQMTTIQSENPDFINNNSNLNKTYFIFEGLYVDDRYSISFDVNTPLYDDVVLYAKYSKDPNYNFYEIVYVVDDEVLPTESILSTETSYKMKSQEKTGYTLKWQVEGTQTMYNPGETYNVSDLFNNGVTSIRLIAVYTIIKYNLTLDIGSNTTLTVTVNGTTYNQSGTYQVEYGSTITYNASASSGYTVSCTINGGDVSTNGTITMESDTTIKTTGTSDSGSCLIEGTLITLADGRKKTIESITPDDLILVFNHETGKFDVSRISLNVHEGEESAVKKILNLVFEDGTIVRIAKYHGFFDVIENKYVYIDYDNVKDYIGHEFYNVEYTNDVFVGDKLKLVNSYVTYEKVHYYAPITAYHLNCFANGILSMTSSMEGLFNIFELDNDMKYDEIKMKEDIEKYGLYTYDDFKDYISYEVYSMFPAKYFKVSVGKGYITFEHIIELAKRYAEGKVN